MAVGISAMADLCMHAYMIWCRPLIPNYSTLDSILAFLCEAVYDNCNGKYLIYKKVMNHNVKYFDVFFYHLLHDSVRLGRPLSSALFKS